MGREAIRARLAAPQTTQTATVQVFGETCTVRQLTWPELEEAALAAMVDDDTTPGARRYSWMRHRMALVVLSVFDADGHRVFEATEDDVQLLERMHPDEWTALCGPVLRLNGFDAALEEARAKLSGGTGAGAQSSASVTTSDASRPS